MPIYNKLVRDKIPDIIEAKGEKPVFWEIEDEGVFLKEALKKVEEEFREFKAEPSIEEACDIIEILYEIFEKDLIEEARLKKLAERGGYKKRIYLEEVK